MESEITETRGGDDAAPVSDRESAGKAATTIETAIAAERRRERDTGGGRGVRTGLRHRGRESSWLDRVRPAGARIVDRAGAPTYDPARREGVREGPAQGARDAPDRRARGLRRRLLGRASTTRESAACLAPGRCALDDRGRLAGSKPALMH